MAIVINEFEVLPEPTPAPPQPAPPPESDANGEAKIEMNTLWSHWHERAERLRAH